MHMIDVWRMGVIFKTTDVGAAERAYLSACRDCPDQIVRWFEGNTKVAEHMPFMNDVAIDWPEPDEQHDEHVTAWMRWLDDGWCDQ